MAGDGDSDTSDLVDEGVFVPPARTALLTGRKDCFTDRTRPVKTRTPLAEATGFAQRELIKIDLRANLGAIVTKR